MSDATITQAPRAPVTQDTDASKSRSNRNQELKSAVHRELIGKLEELRDAVRKKAAARLEELLREARKLTAEGRKAEASALVGGARDGLRGLPGSWELEPFHEKEK